MTTGCHCAIRQERHRFEIGRRVTERLLLECSRADACIALLDGLQIRLTLSRGLRSMFIDQEPNELKSIMAAPFTDAVMSTMRVTDNPQDEIDSLSACVISPMLFAEEHVASLTSDEWLKLCYRLSSAVTFAPRAIEQRRRVEWFRSIVPSGWEKEHFRLATTN